MKSGAEDALPKRDKPADHASAGEANQRLERIIPGGPWPSGHRQAFIPLPLLAMGLLIPFHPFDTNSFFIFLLILIFVYFHTKLHITEQPQLRTLHQVIRWVFISLLHTR